MTQLDNITVDGSEGSFVQSAILRRLADDDPKVVSAALSCKIVKDLPYSVVAEDLGRCFNIAKEKAEESSNSGKSSRKEWRKVTKKVLSLFFGIFTLSFSMSVVLQLPAQVLPKLHALSPSELELDTSTFQS